MDDREKKACIDKISHLEQEKKALLEKLASVENIKKTVRRNFRDMSYLLTSIMSLSNSYLGGHVRRVAVLLRLFSEHLNLGNDTIYLYYYSALFHDIGLVGTKEEIILKPETDLDEEERKEFIKHPMVGEKIIGSMYNLKRVALIIRSHHEEYSGGGYPDGLYGDGIPVGSRFLRIVNDYDNMMFKESMKPKAGPPGHRRPVRYRLRPQDSGNLLRFHAVDPYRKSGGSPQYPDKGTETGHDSQ